jgi:molecular chaperone GrpE
MSKKSKKKHANAEEIMVEENLESEEALEESEQPQTESEATVEELDSPEVVEESLGVDLSPEEIMELQSTLEESQAKAAEYLDGWQRARAEFSNYKKRIEREREHTYKDAAGGVIKSFLPVVDDLERALKNRPEDDNGAAWSAGIELVYRKMLTILENEGITQMKAEGEFFDPNLHEAVVKTESDNHESDQIIEVLEQGYLLGERVLRPAKVRIAA